MLKSFLCFMNFLNEKKNRHIQGNYLRTIVLSLTLILLLGLASAVPAYAADTSMGGQSNPVSVPADGFSAATGTVHVSSGGAPVEGKTVYFNVKSGTPEGVHLANTYAQTDAGGNASYTISSGLQGTYYVQVTVDASYCGEIATSFTAVPQTMTLEASPATALADNTTSPAITATVLDTDGHPVAGCTLNWVTDFSTLSTNTTLTDLQGQSTVTLSKTLSIGSANVSASVAQAHTPVSASKKVQFAGVTGISAAACPVGGALTLTGLGFGNEPGKVEFQQRYKPQGSEYYDFRKIDVTTFSSWSDTSVTVTVPEGLDAGPVANVTVLSKVLNRLLPTNWWYSSPAFTVTAGPLDTWSWRSPSSLPANGILRSIVYDGNKFVAVGDNGLAVITTNGTTWTQNNFIGVPNLYGIAYNGAGTFVAVGSSGQIWSSPNGTSWTIRRQSDSNYLDLTDVAYGNGVFVTGDASGKILYSGDGISWIPVSVPGHAVTGIAFGNGVFVAFTSDGSKVLTSPGGASWTEASTPGTQYRGCQKGVYGAGKFVAVGSNGVIMTSPDGASWTKTRDGSGSFTGVSYGNGHFVAVGGSENILSSEDGITWTQRSNSGHGFALNGIAFGNNTFVAIGWSNTIIQSAGIEGSSAAVINTVAPASTNAAASGNITITFSKTMRAASGAVYLSSDGGVNYSSGLAGGNWSANNSVYTIPYSGLSNNTAYVIKIEGFMDAEGNVIATDTGHSFTTVTGTQEDRGNHNDGGGGSTGGSSGGTVDAGASGTNIIKIGNTAEISVKATFDSNGKASVAATQAQIKDAMAKALETSSTSGGEAKVEIKVDTGSTADTLETRLPKESIDKLAQGRIKALTLTSPLVSVTFDTKALAGIAGIASADVTITSARLEPSALSSEIHQLIGEHPVFDFSVASGEKKISQFGGNVSVSVPYTPREGEDTKAIVIYYIGSDGKLITVPGCKYDSLAGQVSFYTSHFSRYAVGYNKVVFNDVKENAWYRNAVTFLAARGITSGTAAAAYDPDVTLTRGQFITMLLRAYGIAADTSATDNFADAGSTYYTGHLAAAKKLGIASGMGNNKFAPDKTITRQEMFTLLYNALKTFGKLPEGASGKTLLDFSDAGGVAAWATDAMTPLVKAGTVSGSGGKLNPTGTATRAEMAQVLYNLLGE